MNRDININKNTANDKRSILSEAVRNKFGGGWVIDYDDLFVYFELWLEDENRYKNCKLSYSISDMVNVELGEDLIEVVRLTEFKEISSEESIERSLGNRIESWLEKHFGGSKENTYQVIKQFDDEEMIAVEPLYISVGEVDGQGDTVDSIDEMYSLVKSFNEANEAGILQSSLFHNHKTESFSVVKAWVNECECMIGDNLIPEGQPIAKIQFHNESAWKLRKNGTLMGLSIGARASEVENLNE